MGIGIPGKIDEDSIKKAQEEANKKIQDAHKNAIAAARANAAGAQQKIKGKQGIDAGTAMGFAGKAGELTGKGIEIAGTFKMGSATVKQTTATADLTAAQAQLTQESINNAISSAGGGGGGGGTGTSDAAQKVADASKQVKEAAVEVGDAQGLIDTGMATAAAGTVLSTSGDVVKSMGQNDVQAGTTTSAQAVTDLQEAHTYQNEGLSEKQAAELQEQMLQEMKNENPDMSEEDQNNLSENFGEKLGKAADALKNNEIIEREGPDGKPRYFKQDKDGSLMEVDVKEHNGQLQLDKVKGKVDENDPMYKDLKLDFMVLNKLKKDVIAKSDENNPLMDKLGLPRTWRVRFKFEQTGQINKPEGAASPTDRSNSIENKDTRDPFAQQSSFLDSHSSDGQDQFKKSSGSFAA